jgi:hypothetical protein
MSEDNDDGASWRARPRRERADIWSRLGEEDPRFASFMADIGGEDEVGCIIRASTYVEYYLEQIITRHLLHPTEVVWPGLTFQRRLELSLALGDLKPSMKGPLRMLARARNRIAHNPGVEVESEDVRRIVDAFDPSLREQFDGYARIAEKAPSEMTELIAALMVIEQNLRWAVDAPNAMLLIRKTKEKLTTAGLQRFLEEE